MQINSDRVVPMLATATAPPTTAPSAPGRPVNGGGQQPTPMVQQSSQRYHQQHQNQGQNHSRSSTNNPQQPQQTNQTPASGAPISVQIAHPQPQLPPSAASLNPQALAAAANMTTEELNAQLRQLVASESLAQQWNANLLKLSGLQQQNTLGYGPAAAAAAALLNNPAAASYLWPNFAQQCRVALQVRFITPFCYF
jgi:outer membrane biosynthesis protein TonB